MTSPDVKYPAFQCLYVYRMEVMQQGNNTSSLLEWNAHCRSPVLVALGGTSPAVLTETLYALAREQEPVFPERIIVITTSRGRKLFETFFFDNGTWLEFKNTMKKQYGNAVDNKLRFGPIDDCIRVIPALSRDRVLEDIQDLDDNLAVAEFLLEVLRGFCEDDTIDLYASIAGGRKTMGALLVSVMTLIGRANDRILHVLVNGPWERIPGFLYPGCPGVFFDPETGKSLNSRDAGLSLVDVPFIPMRYAFEQELKWTRGGYSKIIELLRKQVINLARNFEYECDLKSGILLLNGIPLCCSHMEFVFYAYFLYRTQKGFIPLSTYAGLEKELRNFALAHHDPESLDHWTHTCIESNIDGNEDPRKWAHNLRKKLVNFGCSALAVNRLVPCRGRLSIDIPSENITMKNLNADRL